MCGQPGTTPPTGSLFRRGSSPCCLIDQVPVWWQTDTLASQWLVATVSTLALGAHRPRGRATAKAGIIGFAKTAAKELAGFGVTVNAVSPNAAMRMTATIPEEKIPDVLEPIARFAEPAGIATAVCFLASEEAGYVTGWVDTWSPGLTSRQ